VTFAQPSQGGQSGDQFETGAHKGHLLLIYPKQYHPEVSTKNGPSSAADVDIIVVDKVGPDGRAASFINARVFGNLANSVRNDVGGQVLGRLDQIQTQGGRTPWVLNNFTEQDAAQAGPVHAAYQQGQFRPTQNPMAAPAPAAPPTGAWNAQAPAQGGQQWNAPAAPPATNQWNQQPAAAPAAQQWNPTPAPQATAPAPPVAPAPAVDPAVIARLNANGIFPPPGTTAEQIMAVAASLPNQPPF
jgi:hypothetical protein